MADTIRSFVAFNLPSDIIDHASGLQSDLKARGLKLRWVRPRNIHLTLKFLGDISQAMIADVGDALGRACRGTAPLALTVQGMGVFPSIKRARVLWIGLGGQVEALQFLYSRIEEELAELGLAREKRGFKAHLTLARMKGPVAPGDLSAAMEATGNYEPRPFRVRRLILYKSDLRPQGAVYTPLVEIDLNANNII
jgi:RNA 2',3'-cyclic 3'-phosphodiesterase